MGAIAPRCLDDVAHLIEKALALSMYQGIEP